MRKLAIFLLVVSPFLTAIGMAGCVASIASIGNTSRQMTPLEGFGLLGSPFLFLAGVVLLIVDWGRRRRRRALDAQEAARCGATGPASTGVIGMTLSVGRIVMASALVAIGYGIMGGALNLFFLIITADAWLTAVESGGSAKYMVIPLACLLGCMPIGYALLAWKDSLRKRTGEALRPYGDAIMKAMESIAVDYARSRPGISSQGAVMAECIRRVASLPEPVKQLLARVVRRSKLSIVLETSMNAAAPAEPDTVVSLAMAGIRHRLDEALFASRKHRLLYLIMINLCLFGLLLGVTGSLASFMSAVIGGSLVAGVILVSNHPVAKDIRGMLTGFVKAVATAVGLVVLSITGLALIRRGRSQSVRWVGYTLVEIIYALLAFITGLVLCEQFRGEQSHIIVPLTAMAFLVPSLLLMKWIRATRVTTAPPPQRTD